MFSKVYATSTVPGNENIPRIRIKTITNLTKKPKYAILIRKCKYQSKVDGTHAQLFLVTIGELLQVFWHFWEQVIYFKPKWQK